MVVKQRKQSKYGVTWQLDADIDACNGCGRPFHKLTRRRHHCRRCGMIFCNACSAQRRTVRGSDNPKRVCSACMRVIDASSAAPLGQKRTTMPGSSADLKRLEAQEQQRAADAAGKKKGRHARHSTPSLVGGDPLPSASIKFAGGTLEDGMAVSCYFDGALISSGTATWYRVPAAAAAQGHAAKMTCGGLAKHKQVATQRIVSARDAVYTVQVPDIGNHLVCCVQPTAQAAVIACSSVPVTQAEPGLQSVEIGLRPHQHTLKCDRSERVCDAAGKFRQGERVFMKAHLQGVDITTTNVTFTWLRSVPLMRRPMVDEAAGAARAAKTTSEKDKDSAKSGRDAGGAGSSVRGDDDEDGGSSVQPASPEPSPKARNRSQGPSAVVLYAFEAEDDNEMSVEKDDVVTDVEVVSDDWTRCSLRGKRGAVPTAYIKVEENSDDSSAASTAASTADNAAASVAASAAPAQPVALEDAAQPEDDESDVSSDDELREDGTKQPVADYRKRWRGSLLTICEWEQVGGGAEEETTSDQHPEYALTLEDVGYMIALEVTMSNGGADGCTPVTKKSIPVGPIEPANCRIDNLRIEGDNRLGGRVKAVYDYYGGTEGASRFSWVRINKDGGRDHLTEFSARRSGESDGGPDTYVLTEDDLGCKLKIHVRVVRNDGLQVSVGLLVCWVVVVYLWLGFLSFFVFPLLLLSLVFRTIIF